MHRYMRGHRDVCLIVDQYGCSARAGAYSIPSNINLAVQRAAKALNQRG
jgi:hypothetical protein